MRVSWSRTRWAAIGAAIALAVGSGTLALVTADGGGAASSFVPIAPCRLIDTRSTSPVGPRSTPITAGESLTVQVTGSNGQCVIPVSATAIVINVTAVGPTAPGYITLYPADVAVPNASNLNFTANQNPTPNLVTVSLSTTGAMKIFNAAGNVNVLGDIAGYYQPDYGLGNAGEACDVNGLAGVIVNGVDTDHNASSKCFTRLVSTLAGSGGFSSAGGQGHNASFSNPTAVAVDSIGNIYVADEGGNMIRKITTDGVVITLAGTGVGGDNNGPGAFATFQTPGGIAVDSVGNVFVADTFNGLIRKVTPQGFVSTFADLNSFGFPRGVAVDESGNVYASAAYSILRITPGGVISTLAGGTQGNADGTGAAAEFNLPEGVAVDAAGNVYVADKSNHRIRKITSGGVVTTLAGSVNGFADGTGSAAEFGSPTGVAVDAAGNVYVADRLNNRIRKVTATGVVTTIAGDSPNGYAEGVGTDARFWNPQGIAIDNSGTLYVADYNGNRIRRIN